MGKKEKLKDCDSCKYWETRLEDEPCRSCDEDYSEYDGIDNKEWLMTLSYDLMAYEIFKKVKIEGLGIGSLSAWLSAKHIEDIGE